MDQEPELPDLIGKRIKEGRKEILLSYDELVLLVEGISELYLKTLRRVNRNKQPRSKKDAQMLGEMQETLQYVSHLKYLWQTGMETFRVDSL